MNLLISVKNFEGVKIYVTANYFSPLAVNCPVPGSFDYTPSDVSASAEIV